MNKLLAIAAGGALGALLRWGIAGWGHGLMRGDFPLGTLIVNVAGCLLFGLAGGLFAGPLLVREDVRLGVLVGLLGGFTTFSTFGWDTLSLITEGQLRLAVLYVVLSNALGLAAAWFGWTLTQGHST